MADVAQGVGPEIVFGDGLGQRHGAVEITGHCGRLWRTNLMSSLVRQSHVWVLPRTRTGGARWRESLPCGAISTERSRWPAQLSNASNRGDALGMIAQVVAEENNVDR